MISGGGNNTNSTTHKAEITQPVKAVVSQRNPNIAIPSRPSYAMNHALSLLSLYQEVALQSPRTTTQKEEYEYAMVLLKAFDKAVALVSDDNGEDIDMKRFLREGLNMNVGAIKAYRECNIVGDCL